MVVVVVAALMPAPITGKLGLAAGIMLGVYTLFQLIAFSTYAAFIKECTIIDLSRLVVGVVVEPRGAQGQGTPMPLPQQLFSLIM